MVRDGEDEKDSARRLLFQSLCAPQIQVDIHLCLTVGAYCGEFSSFFAFPVSPARHTLALIHSVVFDYL